MAHKLIVVDVYTEDDFMSIALTCPDCPDSTFGIQRWGKDTQRKDLVAEAQRQHEITVTYERRKER